MQPFVYCVVSVIPYAAYSGTAHAGSLLHGEMTHKLACLRHITVRHCKSTLALRKADVLTRNVIRRPKDVHSQSPGAIEDVIYPGHHRRQPLGCGHAPVVIPRVDSNDADRGRFD